MVHTLVAASAQVTAPATRQPRVVVGATGLASIFLLELLVLLGSHLAR